MLRRDSVYSSGAHIVQSLDGIEQTGSARAKRGRGWPRKVYHKVQSSTRVEKVETALTIENFCKV